MTKTAINKCPICGGWVTLKTNVDITYMLHEDDGELVTETDDIIDRVHKNIPIEAICEDCDQILDVIKVDTEKQEFTFRANTKIVADIEKECKDYERGGMMYPDSEVGIGLEYDGIWLHDYSPCRKSATVIKKLCEEDEIDMEELLEMCDRHGWSTLGW